MHVLPSDRRRFLSRPTAGLAIVLGVVLISGAGASPPGQQIAKPTGVTEQCATDACHPDIVARKVQHGPVAQKKCTACHAYDRPEEHRFRLANEAGRLCRDCHTLDRRTYVHAPLKQGDCTGCHDPHGSDFRAILTADATRGLCLTCHKQDFAAKKFVHGPVNAGACILCHEPHSSWEPKLLTAGPDKLCVECHSETVPKGERARHTHAPFREAKCTSCHDAHASAVKFQLRDAAPALCLSCHKELAQTVADSRVVHGAVREDEACSSCHTSHASGLPKLQRVSQPQSCLGCHDKAMRAKDGRTIADVSALLKDNPHQHGPIRDGGCTACHQPHAGQHFRLLAADYPPEFYAPFEIDRYALCFKCHMPELVLKERGRGVTQFRNGDANLHWVHVNREKGRTCRACHEVHASRNPFHLRDAVPFGTKGWLLEVGFKKTSRGGTCDSGCHAPKEYDRGVEAQPPQPPQPPPPPPPPETVSSLSKGNK